MSPLNPLSVAPCGIQSTSSCGESTGSCPVAMKTADSIDSVAEKAQQEPHPPWFLVGVTAPFVRQSTWGDNSVSSCRSYGQAKGPGASAGAFPVALSLYGEEPRGPRRSAKGSCGTRRDPLG